MGKLFEWLSGPIDSLIDTAVGVFDEIHVSGEEKLKFKQQMMEAKNDFSLAVIEAEQKLAKERSDIIQAEINSESWLARSWRPILMLTFTYVIAHVYVLAPVFGLPIVEIPAGMWALLNIGVGGYIGARSVEKITMNRNN